MFGTANQLLASIALAVGTSYIINRGKIKYALITIVPFIFIGFTTLYAGFANIITIYFPQILKSETRIQGIINLTLSGIIIFCACIVFYNAIPKWVKAYQKARNIGLETE
jgi:carbon starvation protein